MICPLGKRQLEYSPSELCIGMSWPFICSQYTAAGLASPISFRVGFFGAWQAVIRQKKPKTYRREGIILILSFLL
ncbi:hypothetical protein COMNV_01073 [Commensalibacter sp. Nvir]|uniref:hypothetical protein n=1 Tax=Commensalibacter sp. Nvir TaxID=3069817 RepID=UPI002D2E07C9|nr:hypothetical protein COMNV_01073 [Commensalibacter sp. Nvir]